MWKIETLDQVSQLKIGQVLLQKLNERYIVKFVDEAYIVLERSDDETRVKIISLLDFLGGNWFLEHDGAEGAT